MTVYDAKEWLDRAAVRQWRMIDDSTNLAAVRFAPLFTSGSPTNDEGYLFVRFLDGSEYCYGTARRLVPRMLYDGIFAASSKGQFFATMIRNSFTATRTAPARREGRKQ